MNKYTVSWVSGNISQTHGSFDSYDEAFESIRKWWNYNGYSPAYIRVIGDIEENGKVKIDYGLHESFYYIVEEEKESDKNPYFDTVSSLYKELIEKDITIRKQQEVIDNLEQELNIWKHYH